MFHKTCCVITDEDCRDDEFTCRDRACIPSSRVCDGLGDCSDRSDEREDECDITICKFMEKCSKYFLLSPV